VDLYGVPGPGTYEPEHKFPVASFKMMKKENFNKMGEPVVNNAQYYPKPAYDYKPVPPGIKFGTSLRNGYAWKYDENKGGDFEAEKSNNTNPAPNAYTLLGDFDFKDPSRPIDDVLHDRGKHPRFAFGAKPNIKSKNQDFPGPAEYEVDQYPMN
jgi:hypothetical protein